MWNCLHSTRETRGPADRNRPAPAYQGLLFSFLEQPSSTGTMWHLVLNTAPELLNQLLKFNSILKWFMNACMLACSVTSVVSSSLWPCGLLPTRLLCPWDSPGKNTGVGCHALLQGIFPAQGLNPHLSHHLHCRWILYPLSHLGSPNWFIGTLNFEI